MGVHLAATGCILLRSSNAACIICSENLAFFRVGWQAPFGLHLAEDSPFCSPSYCRFMIPLQPRTAGSSQDTIACACFCLGLRLLKQQEPLRCAVRPEHRRAEGGRGRCPRVQRLHRGHGEGQALGGRARAPEPDEGGRRRSEHALLLQRHLGELRLRTCWYVVIVVAAAVVVLDRCC